MPRNKAYEFKVGVFVVGGIAILVLFIVSLTGIGFRTAEDEYSVMFKNAAGLENGSIVALGGLKVGRVVSVGISKKEPDKMEAIIRVKSGSPIRENSRVEVTSVGITGSMFLAISLGTSDAKVLKPGARIVGTEAASFQAVINNANAMTRKVNVILGDLGKRLDVIGADAEALMKDIRGQARKVLASTDRVLKRVENILSDENERRINRFLVSISHAAENLDKNIAPTVREFQLTMRRARRSLGEVDRTARAYTKLAGSADNFIGDLKVSLKAANRVLARLDNIGAGIEKIVDKGEGAVGELLKILEAEIRGVREDLQKELAATGKTLRGELRGVGGQARSTLKEGGKSLDNALRAIEGVSRQVQDFFESNKSELKTVIVNINSASKRVDNILKGLSSGSDGSLIQNAAKDLRRALRRAHSLLSQLDDTVSSHREDVQLLITDLRDTAKNLNAFTTNLKERPATVIFQQPARPREFAQ